MDDEVDNMDEMDKMDSNFGSTSMRLIELFLGLFCRLYCRTLRIKLLLPDGRLIPLREYQFRRVIFAHSERINFGIAPALLLAPFVILLARGRDGDRAAPFFRSVGCEVIRGSSRRSGATALRHMIRILRNHEGPSALAVDGPIGPPGAVKPGIFSCAFHTGRTIIPLGAAAAPCVVFRRSWPQTFLPLPGARGIIVTGDDLHVTDPLSSAELDLLTRELGARLKAAQERAENLLHSRLE